MSSKLSDPFNLSRSESRTAGLHMFVIDQGSLSRDLEIDEPMPQLDETFYPDTGAWDGFVKMMTFFYEEY